MTDETSTAGPVDPASSHEQQLSPRAKWIAVGLLATMGIGGTLILGEVALRVAAVVSPAMESLLTDPMAILIEPYGEFGYRQKPGSVFEYDNGTRAVANAAGYRGPVVESPKSDGVVRILLFGGSATHGWGVNDSETIDTYMREILTTRDPTRRYEVVNLAFDAHDSWQIYERLRTEGLALEPDVVIVNAGVNDVGHARFQGLQDVDSRTLIWEGALADFRRADREGHLPLWLRIKHHVYLARLPAAFTTVASQRGGVTAAPEPGPYPDAMDYFERNVRRVVETALAGGAAVILSTEPSALLLNYAPTDTSHRGYWIRDAATTQEYRDSLSGRMVRIQAEMQAAQLPVRHVRPSIPGSEFLDDAHLTASGNRMLAAVFADEVLSLIAP